MKQFSLGINTVTAKVNRDTAYKKISARKGLGLEKIDMIALKRKGLSIAKISQMLNVPETVIEKQINFFESCLIHSGIY